MTEPAEVHHIADGARIGHTYCGIDMPSEQLQVRTRGPARICPECAERFRAHRRGEI